jgi:hypothetical protein
MARQRELHELDGQHREHLAVEQHHDEAQGRLRLTCIDLSDRSAMSASRDI